MQEETVWITEAKEGKQSAFRELFDANVSPLYWFLKQFGSDSDQVEEWVQRAFIKAFAHLDSFDGKSRFSSWLFRLALNEMRMDWRRRQIVAIVPVDEGIEGKAQEPEMSMRSNRSFWTWLNSIFSGSFTRKEVEGEIFVPRSNALNAEVRYGSIDMEGMKGALSLKGTGNTVELKDCSALGELMNDYGKATIESCAGTLRVSSKSTTVLIDQFEGKVTIDADYSNITVRDVSQSLTIRSTSGTIKVDHVGGDASVRADYTNITANNIAGMLDVVDKSGKIRAKGVDGVKVDGTYSSMEISDVSGKSGNAITLNGQSGQIFLSNAVGDVQIENLYGTIDLKEIKGNVEVKSKSSNVRASGVSGDWNSVTEYCTLRLRDIRAKRVAISNRSGQIDVALRITPTFVDIKNEYAKVSLEMPSGFSGDVDLNVTYGHIETNLPLSKTKSFEGGGGYALGKIGNGNGKLSVETKSGNLSVMQR